MEVFYMMSALDWANLAMETSEERQAREDAYWQGFSELTVEVTMYTKKSSSGSGGLMSPPTKALDDVNEDRVELLQTPLKVRMATPRLRTTKKQPPTHKQKRLRVTEQLEDKLEDASEVKAAPVQASFAKSKRNDVFRLRPQMGEHVEDKASSFVKKSFKKRTDDGLDL